MRSSFLPPEAVDFWPRPHPPVPILKDISIDIVMTSVVSPIDIDGDDK
jgi:hypothetical protein